MRRALVGLLLLALTGCGGLPTDELVRDGRAPTEVGAFSDLPVGVTAPGPTEGQSPEEVVRGFLQAQNSEAPTGAPPAAGEELPVARQFLAPEAVWDALGGVVVYDGARPPRVLRSNGATAEVRVTATRRAVVDAGGAYTPSPGEVEVDFELRRVAGQWRLARVPTGLLLTPNGLRRNYRPVTAYFPTPDGARLVPDPLWLPGPATELPAQLVAALLRGPSPWLSPAVLNPLPSGTRLARPVTVREGVVAVELDERALATPATEALVAEFAWTLGRLPDVRAVRLRAGGAALTERETERPDDWPGYDPDVLRGGTAYYVREGLRLLDGPPVDGPVGQGSPPLRRPAVSPSAGLVAGLVPARGGTELWTGPLSGDLVRRLPAGTHTPPSWGSGTEGVWTVRGAPGERQEVLVVPVEGQPTPVALRGAGTGPVTALRVSRDGARVALVTRRRDRDGAPVDALQVGRVVRTRDGRLVVDGLREVAPALRLVRDLAWRDAQTLAVLGGRQDEASVSPYLVAADGSRPEDPVPSGSFEGPLTAIAAAPGSDVTGAPLVVQSGEELRIKGRDVVWARGPTGVDPAYPG